MDLNQLITTFSRRWRGVVRKSSLLVLLVLVPTSVVVSPQEARPLPQPYEDTINVLRGTVEVSLWPTSQDAAERGICEKLRVSDLVVTVNGTPARATSLDYQRRRTLHVFFIDVSGSMGPLAIDEFKPGLEQYVNSLRNAAPRDAIMLTKLGHDLSVILPPASLAAPRSVEIPSHLEKVNRVWEGIHTLLRFVKTRDMEIALILVTDALDYQATYPIERVVQVLENSPRIVVFPVMPRFSFAHSSPGRGAESYYAGKGDLRKARSALTHLATISGGRLYDGTGSLGRVAEDVIRRLRGRAELTYSIPEGNSKPMAGKRRVKVRVAPRIPCRVTTATRTAHSAEDAKSFLARAAEGSGSGPVGIGEALRRLGLIAVSGPHAAQPLLLHPGAPAPGFGGEWVDAWFSFSPRYLVFRAPAIVIDGGRIPSWSSYWKQGVQRQAGKRSSPQQRAYRPLAVRVPLVEEVLESIHSAGSALLQLAREGVESGRDHEQWPAVGSPVFVEAKTFLEWQEAISSAICNLAPDWKQWSEKERERRIDQEIEWLMGQDAAFAQAPPTAARAVRRQLRKRLREQNRWPEWVIMGGLLGDVPAQDVAREIDMQITQALLTPAQARNAEQRWLILEQESIWNRMMGWLPTGTSVRSLVPLVPVYDARQKRIGFWRVILPFDVLRQAAILPDDFVPEAPLGARLIRHLVGEAGLVVEGAAFRGGTSLDYGVITPQRVKVALQILPSSGTGEGTHLRALFRRRVPQPGKFLLDWSCAEVGGAGPLEGAIRRQHRICSTGDL